MTTETTKKELKTESISYEELARRVGNMILCNSINEVDESWYEHLIESPRLMEALDERNAELEAENGEDYEPESLLDYADESYQAFIIDARSAEYLANHTRELIQYVPKLDVFVWHIGHYGTSWSHVSTTFYEIEDYGADFVSIEKLIKGMN